MFSQILAPVWRSIAMFGSRWMPRTTGTPVAGLLAVCTPLLLCASCTVGPDFVKPALPSNATYASAHAVTATVATPGVGGGTAQSFSKNEAVPDDWWTLFHSPALDGLVTSALKNNHDLKAAKAALRVAHESVLTQRGTFIPSLAAGISASRQQDPAATLSPTPANNALLYSLITPQLSVSYAPDLFGLNRRTRESLKAQAQAVRFQMVATRITLTTNVVVAAIRAAGLNAQLAVRRKLAELENKRLGILKLRLARGDANKLDVVAQASQLAQTRAALPALVKERVTIRHALDVMIGAFPDHVLPPLTLSALQLPVNLPLSLPSQLVAQRPDVRQAQADLHAASAAVGIAAAERLPQIELSANVGDSALAISKVFTSGTGFWGLAASLAAPIFEGGQLLHQERAAKAAYVEAAQQYRGTVLHAFQNVADVLTALRQDAKGLHATATAAHAAKTGFALAGLQLRHGAISTFDLLAAQQQYEQARVGLIQAQVNRFSDTAALYQALGGGWWHQANFSRKK